MPIAFRATNGVSVSVWDGLVSSEDVLRHIETLGEDPIWGASRRFLTDLSGVATDSIPNPEQTLEAAAHFLEQLGDQARGAKWAIIASAAFAQARRFGTYIEEEVPRVIVFSDLTTACIWLGVNEPAVRAVTTDLRRTLRHRPSCS
jgi:hypothetical protein